MLHICETTLVCDSCLVTIITMECWKRHDEACRHQKASKNLYFVIEVNTKASSKVQGGRGFSFSARPCKRASIHSNKRAEDMIKRNQEYQCTTIVSATLVNTNSSRVDDSVAAGRHTFSIFWTSSLLLYS